ncbi:MAG: type II toxin-antitoxin system RelE/ParE family toxin [Betaproteobacteria bacterium]|nr:type II toxin-antitoxin system RelE/ParE family toxin [Betaproteobacteria bacterium]
MERDRARQEAIKTLNLRITEPAEADFAEIWAYLAAEASDAVATRFFDALERKCVALCTTPHIGAPRDVFRRGLRVVFHGAYALYYITTGDDLVIVRVLHGARDVAALADRGGFGGA